MLWNDNSNQDILLFFKMDFSQYDKSQPFSDDNKIKLSYHYIKFATEK